MALQGQELKRNNVKNALTVEYGGELLFYA